MSVEGLFVRTSECPPVSTVVRGQVLLPELETGGSQSQRLLWEIVGRVVRTDDGESGFAIRLRKSSLSEATT